MFVSEPGEAEMRVLWAQADEVFAVSIGYLEVRSAIARRLTARTAAAARKQLDEYWQGVETFDVDDRLIALAANGVDTHRLRTFDALHLAAAVDLRDPALVIASWDVDLRRAAEAEGLTVAP